jgi:serine protease AprX
MKTKRTIVLTLIVIIVVGSASAGLNITPGSGITPSGAGSIVYGPPPGGISFQALEDDPVGISFQALEIDNLLALRPNNLTAPTAPGITEVGAEGFTFTGSNSITATGVNSLTIAQGSGITARGADVLTITNPNGNSYQVDSVFIHQANGIRVSGIDTLKLNGLDGVSVSGANSRNIVYANGVTAFGIGGTTVDSANGIIATGSDGQVFSIAPGSITISGANGITATGSDDVRFNGADSLTMTGFNNPTPLPPGIRTVDPGLATLLDRITNDSNVNAAVVYHQAVTDSDIATLRQLGVLVGQRYRVLPVVALTATKGQILQISRLPAVRSIYGNRTLQLLAEPGNGLTGTARVKTDAELTAANGGQTVTGRNVTVAVLDTGLDGTHGDLSGRVVRNAKLVGIAGLGVSFNYPITVEGLPNTDLVSGHGTFVGGVIAGNGARSGGAYTGVAPSAKLVGVSTGDLSLISVIEGFDYILWKQQELGIKVVNCSFSGDAPFDLNDPVNLATRMLTDRGVSVVFAAGNGGPGLDTLNPYSRAPWVISVGATDERGRPAGFSSRGSFTKMSKPSLVAPGVNVVGTRASGVDLNGLLNLGLGGDLSRLNLLSLDPLFYTVGSGTSFSAPQVSGTIALMLDVNPSLTPAQIKDILQRTATPLPPYYRYEVGAGMLNAHAAVLEAAFSGRRMGIFRASLDRRQARFVNDPLRMFSGTVPLGLLGLLGSYTANINIPQNSLLASVQVAWGPELSINDLSMQLTAPNGATRPVVNTLNLPILTGRRERDLIKNPAPGTWRVKLTHTLIGTPEDFIGTLETTRAEYPPLSDISGLTAAQKADAYQNLRWFAMATSSGDRFRPQFTISRFDLASALVVCGRVPQYMGGQPRFTDATDKATRIMVESVQMAPGGPLFTDASTGGPFRPDDRATRLTAAIALVRAAGLRSEAESKAGISLSVSDAISIPSNLRGYVWVALNRGLMTSDGGVFRPNDAMKRVELARAMVVMTNLATQ